MRKKHYLCMLMRYVDVILPVPLEGTFTYSASDELIAKCSVGGRVLVPFKNKTYAGIVVRIHDEKPPLPDDKIRNVLDALDNIPAALPQQLRLWQWIASYYMSPIGDVMKAALPSGLKAETGFKPKTETMVAIGNKYDSETGWSIALEMLRRAPRQQHLFSTLLSLIHPKATIPSHPTTTSHSPSQQISREELLNEAHCTNDIFRKLVEQGFLKTYEKEVDWLNMEGTAHPERLQTLSEPQEEAFRQIKLLWQEKNVVLLHGVTSGGKTEIYIHLIQEAINRGEQVLYLLPEIALTVQMTQRLQHVFGSRLGIYHSKYSDAERVEIWRRQLSDNPYSVILGARSAVFLPFRRLGMIIVDEEHVQSFKQLDPSPRYHARSVAIVLAQMYGAKTLLGTATPSAESWHNATTGKYGFARLSRRYKDIQLPEIEVVDTKDLRHRKMMSGPFSPRLLNAMQTALADGKQVILFQNRRGFAPVLSCRVCGWTPKCKNCDVTLTYHKRLNLLTCHYCGYTEKVPEACPNCDNTHLSDRGYGTEKIEDLIRNDFPNAKVARMDLDTTHTRNAYERIIKDFGTGKTDVLIGTQMISKGLDFANVAVVGILDADSMLHYPDFRAFEQAFQMMSQVAGRAGRKDKRGLVILQTREPKLPLVRQVVNNDFKGFFNDIMEERTMFHYPPFHHLIYIYLRHKDEGIVEMAAQEMGARLRGTFGERILGPDKPAVARVKTLFIRKIVVKLELGANQTETRQKLYAIRNGILSQACYKSVQAYFDVDPL